MNKIIEFLKDGSVTLKKVNSPINGELVVKWDTYGGYQIMGGGLWQVGGPVENVWKDALSELKETTLQDPNILILGVGGGTIAKLTRRKYPKSEILGVDIDPVIVQLGKDYLGLNKLSIEIKIDDAENFLSKNKTKFDLVCVDLYVGDMYPEKFESEKFVNSLKKTLTPDGIVLVNRLYYGKKRAIAQKFLKILSSKFENVNEVYPSVAENVVYIAQWL